VKNDFIAISIIKLKKCNPDIPFNLYIKIGGEGDEQKFAQIFSKNTGIDYSRLAHYIHKGVQDLFIKREDEFLLDSFLKNSAKINRESKSSEEKLKQLLNVTDQILSEIFEGSSVLSETAEETKVLVKKYIDTLNKHPDYLKILFEMANHGDQLYAHSLSVAVLSLFIAKNFGEFNEDFLENLTVGALYHDVGYIKLNLTEVDQTEDEVRKEDWILHKSHPKLGLELLSVLKGLPQEVQFIVYQHHEHYDGRGYPNQLKGDSIFILSQIVCLADEYCKAWQMLTDVSKNSPEPHIYKVIEAKKNYFHPKVFDAFSKAFVEIYKKNKKTA